MVFAKVPGTQHILNAQIFFSMTFSSPEIQETPPLGCSIQAGQNNTNSVIRKQSLSTKRSAAKRLNQYEHSWPENVEQWPQGAESKPTESPGQQKDYSHSP